MLTLHRISRLREPRSNRASTALLILTFSVFAALGHLAIEQQRSDADWVQDSTPATSKAALERWSLLQHLRF